MTEIIQETYSLNSEIDKWNEIVQSDNTLVDVAFFKIFVKFEIFLVEMFTSFSTGVESSTGYLPPRKLEFNSYEHLRNTVTDKAYIDFNNRIESLSKQIFEDNNPFNFFFASDHMGFYTKMKYLRNYIAHESPESKKTYMRKTLCSEEFIEPATFLMKRQSRGSTVTNYSYFIDIVKIYSNSIIGNTNE